MNLAALALAAAVVSPSVDASPVGRVLFHLSDPRITEASGIAVATREPGVWFTHNDSGDSARFFAVGPTGRTLATYDVDGVKAIDWEDMAAAPLRGVPTLWFGDIGDNTAHRPYVSVYAVPEPGVYPGQRGGTVHVHAVRYRFRYPDAPHDAETLLVDPVTSRIYIATKTYNGFTALYMAPLHPSASRIEWLVELSSRSWTPRPGSLLEVSAQLATTGGAFSPDGRSFVLRTYTDAYLFRLRGSALADVAAALVGAPERIRLPREPQGEGIGFRRDGKALVIDSEGVGSAVDEVLLPQAVASPSTTAPPQSSAGSSAEPTRAVPPTPSMSPAPAASKASSATRLVAPVLSGLLVLAGLIAVAARRRRAGPARSNR